MDASRPALGLLLLYGLKKFDEEFAEVVVVVAASGEFNEIELSILLVAADTR